jgi:hypothetical protein
MVSKVNSVHCQATIFVAVQMTPHSEISPIGVFASQQAARAACEECHTLVYGGDLCWTRYIHWITPCVMAETESAEYLVWEEGVK